MRVDIKRWSRNRFRLVEYSRDLLLEDGMEAQLITLCLFVGLIAAAPAPPKRAPVPAKHAPASVKHAPASAKHAPVPAKGSSRGPSCPSNLRPRGGKTFIGYNGFNGTPRKQAQASAGGELGAVFYIADAVDLAKAFAHGADPSKDYVCMVYADSDAWHSVPKVWVPANAPFGNAMNTHYVGAVLFAAHTTAGLPAGHPSHVNQLGIRQAQISRLGLTVECYEKSCFAADHHQLPYDGLVRSWSIQRG